MADLDDRSPVKVPTPTVGAHAANKTYVDGAIAGVSGVPASRTVGAGTGLTGGGALSADISLAVAYGTTASTAAQGNDSRLSDARTPTGAAGGSLADTYPNPSVAAGAIGSAEIASAIKDPAAGTAGLRTLGTGAQQAAAGNDSRLSDARTPTTHSHVSISSLSNVANGGTINCNVSSGNLFRVTTTGAGATLAVPTNAVDGSPINVEVTPNVALSLSLNASIVNCTGVTFPYSAGANKKVFLGLRPISSTWYLLAVGIQP